MTFNQKDEVKVFKSLLINKIDDRYSTQIAEIAESELPQGMWRSMSTIHLSTTKTHWLLRAAGLSSGTFQWCQALILPVQCPPAHPEYQTGDKVLLTGWGVGEKHWGGLSEKAR
jgi:acrylyl-CoA reductase (NADPH)